MAFEQQPPLEVFVSPRPEIAYGDMYDGTVTFLEAAQTDRPYAGLMLRDGMPTDLAAATQHPDREIRDNAIKQGYFLAPINQAMRDVWDANPPTGIQRLRDLRYHHPTTAPYAEPHTDQVLAGMAYLPDYGPLSVLATAYGIVNYRLTILPIDVFKPEDNERFDFMKDIPLALKADPTVLMRSLTTHCITAGPTDILAFTNIPPTIHMAQSSVMRLSAVHFSYFTRIEPVK